MDHKGKTNWSIVGLVALAVVAALVSAYAVFQYRIGNEPAPVVTPSTIKPSATQTPSQTPTPTPSATPTPLTPLEEFQAAFLAAKSVLVYGDGTGNEDHEWVSVWAKDHLAQSRAVQYALWNRESGSWNSAQTISNSGAPLTVWNGSVLAPVFANEPGRITQSWQNADTVLLSYGHMQTADQIVGYLDSILSSIRNQSSSVPIAVILQNPDPSQSAARQTATVEAVGRWASEKGLPTIDVYGGFPTNQVERDALVGVDGSPNTQGSILFARIIAENLPLA